ncbi:MAG TPA: hypothetical protein VHY76_01130 [Acetobacteraceae bacterium]|nr:hypothetical protein [Acetobacteraceae bacterium]
MPEAAVRRPRSRRRPIAFAALALLGALAGCEGQAALAPAPGVAPGYGYTCFAGAYTCTLPQQGPVGAPCSCPGIGAPSYGTVR